MRSAAAMNRSILLALSIYCMGFLAAIPVGATQREIARRAIRGHLGPAQMIVAGF